MAERPFGHESSAINVKRILALMGTLALFVVISVGVLHFVLHRVMPDHAQVQARAGAIPPPPRLQPHPDPDLAALRAQKRALLTHYAWVDPSHHYARIPIQRAMQLYAHEQAKAQPAPQQTAGGGAR